MVSIDEKLKEMGLIWKKDKKKIEFSQLSNTPHFRERMRQLDERILDEESKMLKENWKRKTSLYDREFIADVFSRLFEYAGHLEIKNKEIFYESFSLENPMNITERMIKTIKIELRENLWNKTELFYVGKKEIEIRRKIKSHTEEADKMIIKNNPEMVLKRVFQGEQVLSAYEKIIGEMIQKECEKIEESEFVKLLQKELLPIIITDYMAKYKIEKKEKS